MKKTEVSTELHPPKVWERFADDAYSIFKHMHLEHFSLSISLGFFIKTLTLLWRKKVM